MDADLLETEQTPVAVPFDRTEHGARVIVKWSKLGNRSEGLAYEVREPGAALITFGGAAGANDTLQLLGSNDGDSYHLLVGRSGLGAVTLHAMPLFIKPAIWGGDETEITVAISLNDTV